ncbi:hypothetical protein D3C87_1735260 [compost metagenome]
MAAECVRNIAVGFPEDHQDFYIVRNRASRPAFGLGDAQRADLGFFDQAEDFEGKFPLTLTASGILGGNRRNVPGAGQNVVSARHAGIIGGCGLYFRIGHCGFSLSGCDDLRHGRAAGIFFWTIRRPRAA